MKSALLFCASLVLLGPLSSASTTVRGTHALPLAEASAPESAEGDALVWVWDEPTQTWIQVPVEHVG